MTVKTCVARISLCLLFVPLPLHADVFNIAWDNDLFTGSDRGYTNGVRLSYLTSAAEAGNQGSASLARAARDGLTFLPGVGDPANQHAVSFSLRQLMVTPEDINREEPQLDDMPYAGHLSLSGTLWSWNNDTVTGFGGHLGVVGPESGAEAIQKWVHKVTGSEDPRGWDNQLGTDVIGGLQAAHGRKLLHAGQTGDIEQQLSVVGSAVLSNFRTTANTGLIWRLGRHLPTNFIPDYAGTAPTIALPGSFSESAPAWSVFIGLGVEYIAYSYLEDNADDYRFKEDPFLAQIGLGGTWQWDRLQAALILRASTGEEQRNQDNFSFGTLSLSWAL